MPEPSHRPPRRQATAVQGRPERPVRVRATAIVIKAGRALLLREPEDSGFHLPGGGVESGELPIAAVARELHEETGLEATRVEYLFTYYEDWSKEGRRYSGQDYYVFQVGFAGEIALGPEIEEYTWWGRSADVPLQEHVQPILSRL